MLLRRVRRTAGWIIALLAAALALLPAGAAMAADATDAAVTALLAQARAEAAQGCGRPGAAPTDRLVAILCAGRIVVGVKGDYPVFGVGPTDAPTGFEPDIARAIAARLGVTATFQHVTAANRIAALGEGTVDLVIATLGHTSQRDGQVRFIRPHYFQSRTVLVGPQPLPVGSWNGLAGAAVCVTVGNNTNAALAGHGARLLLFDAPPELVDALLLGTCSLAAHDDSFFASALADPAFARRFAVKFGFAPLPWGMAVQRRGAEHLAALLDLLSLQFHREGVFLDLAARNGAPLAFLRDQQAVWRTPGCIRSDGGPAASCLAAPVDSALPPTPFAARVEAAERWLKASLGLRVDLPMLKTAPAWALFLDGLVNSLVMVSGGLAATFGLTLAFAAALTARSRALRLPVRLLTLLGQSSPIVLLMFLGYVAASAVVTYSVQVAMLVAVLTIGLYNASYAGPAVAEASRALQIQDAPKVPLQLAVRHAGTQVLAFLVNAAKCSSIASLIGVPELLDSLTDIASFSNERVTTFTVLLLFYSAVVGVVVWAGEALRRRLEAPEAAA
jgi:ABC-type amino acid transport substrate-binding protein/ABC-type amino acid transport system permease subunit